MPKKNKYFQYDAVLIYAFALRFGSAYLLRNSTLHFRAVISNCTFALHFCLALLSCLICTLAHLCTALLS